MARGVEEIDDPTPLAGARVDIGARIGWLLRTSRTAAGLSLRELCQRADDAGSACSPATLSRLETAGRRSGASIAVYERTLGLPYGHLRAPVDVLCRTFDYAPADADPYRPEPSLGRFTEACRAVTGSPTGQDWLRFAEFHTLSDFGLPADLVEGHVARLTGELTRSTGTAFQLRYEALAELRCSAYAEVVDRVVREATAAPGIQRPSDLVSCVTELPTAALLGWCGDLLRHESWVVARAGCLGIQNMRSVGGVEPDEWSALVAPYADACDAAAGDPLREPILSETLAACAPAFRAAVHERLRQPLAEPRRPVRWSRDGLNDHYGVAATLAARVARSRPGEPMLARLVFEVLYDFRATHTVTSAMLLMASAFADDVREQLAATALTGPDEVTRHGAAAAFVKLMSSFDAADLLPWLGADDPVIRGAGLTICGLAGVPLPVDQLHEMVGHGGELAHNALFAAGMAGHPELASLAADPELPAAVREGARWWLDTGPRITA